MRGRHSNGTTATPFQVPSIVRGNTNVGAVGTNVADIHEATLLSLSAGYYLYSTQQCLHTLCAGWGGGQTTNHAVGLSHAIGTWV